MIPTELNGSLILYRKLVRPYFLKHHSGVDSVLAKAKDSGNKVDESEPSITGVFSATKLLDKSD